MAQSEPISMVLTSLQGKGSSASAFPVIKSMQPSVVLLRPARAVAHMLQTDMANRCSSAIVISVARLRSASAST